MKPCLLILRPEPGASATAARAAALGWQTIQAPLFRVAAMDWAPPHSTFDAVMMTSANAARLAGAGLAKFVHLPLYAVGRATADTARAAGFVDVRIGTGDAEALLADAASDGAGTLLHLAGREHRPVARAGMIIERHIVYGADPVDRLPDAAAQALADGAIALLHSPRAATLFAMLTDATALSRRAIRIAAISLAARDAAGAGWAAALAAACPDDDALLAAAARLCE
jgi:uroporphyrinogen-III synthase